VDTTETITHLSLCSGYEGIGLGLRRVLPNVREIAHVEIESFAIQNLVTKMEKGLLDAAPIFTDLKTFPYEQFCGKVSILSGGFPCQGFSQAGKKEGVNDSKGRHLFPYIAEGIRKCRPGAIFLENVQGILSCKTNEGEPVLQYVLRTLEELGYRATAGIFSASEVGAPHQRKRVFILAYRNSIRHDGRELSDRDGRWSLPKQAQPRPGKPLVWGEVEGCGGDSRTVLGNPSTDELQIGCPEAIGEERQSEQGRLQESQRGSIEPTELGNTRSSESHGVADEERTCVSTTRDTSQELPNSNCGRGKIQDQRQITGESLPKCVSGAWGSWPSRPGEFQHEWEEPRVVKTESGLGRATDGTSSRVDANRIDRLRCLGNGVLPATAAKAFVVLSHRLLCS
jgi:DNA (cytosine-5)-methyltransferase 1